MRWDKNVPILHVDQPFGVRITKVTGMRRSEVDFGLGKGVEVLYSFLVREHASRKAGNNFLHMIQMGAVKNIIVDQDILA